MKTHLALLASLLLAGCSTTSAKSAPPEKPAPPNLSPQVRTEMRGWLDKQDPIFHLGCKDEEKASCQDPRRYCGADVAKRLAATLGKGKEVAVEWEEPRETWMKNEGVLDQYWRIRPDRSAVHHLPGAPARRH